MGATGQPFELTQGMPNFGVAMHAGEHVLPDDRRQQRMRDRLVAVDAGAVRDRTIAGLDLDRVLEIAERESQRMKETVIRLGDPLADRVVGQMAIVANRHVVMAAVLPGIEVLLHDVAVDTRLRIVAEVAGALSVAEREGSQTHEQPQAHGKQQRTSAQSPGVPNWARSDSRIAGRISGFGILRWHQILL